MKLDARTPNMRDTQKYVARSFHTYEINVTAALAAGANTLGTFTVDQNCDFFWTKFTGHVTSGNDGTTRTNELIPEIDLVITDAGSQRNLMNIQVPMRNITGTGEIPFILPIEGFLSGTSQVSVQFFNVSDNTSYSTIKLSFIGVKAFLRGGPVI